MNTQKHADNPFFRQWTAPGEVPPFEQITPEHFAPAYARAFADHETEVAAIAGRPAPPDFANTIAALELSGRELERVEQVFHLLDLLRRLIAARNFGQGFATVEYVASAIVDLDFHSLMAPETIDPGAFEVSALNRIGMPTEIAMRHRPPHFAHVFSGGGYAAAYYSYMWSEVLDAVAFEAFEETGDIFDPATAKRLRETIYAAGGAQDPVDAYKAFRGRLPSAEALLRKRGLRNSRARLAGMELHTAGHR